MTNTGLYAPYQYRTAFDILFRGDTAIDDEVLRVQATAGDLLARTILDEAQRVDILDHRVTELTKQLRQRLDHIADSIKRAYAHSTLSNADDGGKLDVLLAERQAAIATLTKLVTIYHNTVRTHS